MTDQYPSNVEVHAWAREQPWGHKVSSRAISRQLILAWDRAHPDRPYVRSEAYHGTEGGYVNHNCRCDRCTDVATRSTAIRRDHREEWAS